MEVSSIDPQIKAFVVFGIIVVSIVLFLTLRLIEETNRDKLIGALKSKQLRASEQAATAIVSAEKRAKQDGGRKRKYPMESINFRAVARDLRSAGLPPLPPLVFVAAGFIAFFFTRIVLNIPVLPFWIQFAVVIWPFYLLVRYPVINSIIDMRKMKILKQMITFIDAVQRSVSVGISVEEAVSEAIGYTDKPLREHLVQVRDLIGLGYDFIDAIQLAADQLDLPEFDIFAASVQAQTTSGGTIGDVLKEVVAIARKRLEVKKKVATITAEGRFNALLFGSLPIGLSLYLRSAQPEYFNELWQIPNLGALIYGGIIALSVVGGVMALRIARVKV